MRVWAAMQSVRRSKSTPLFVIFTTVLMDLVGFGMVIPLVGLYGRHFQATNVQLAILGGIFSLMSFIFSPWWGSLSDRYGRRPILLISLVGQAVSYLIFGLAGNYWALLISRAFAGVFAGNFSAAQAYVADVTTREERAKGMGMIGAAFGIGFTFGPALGGLASAKLGLGAPGLIAAAICALNAALAYFRLPESLPKEKRSHDSRYHFALDPPTLKAAFRRGGLGALLVTFFFVTFGFSNMEQTFSLLFQQRFGFETGDAGLKTGLIFMWSGLFGAAIQGGGIRKLVPKYGEWKLLQVGLLCNMVGVWMLPFVPSYELYYLFILPLSVGSALINPCLSSLISKSADAQSQGRTLGLSQGLGALARAVGPFAGLLTFAVNPAIPYVIGSVMSGSCLLFWLARRDLQKA